MTADFRTDPAEARQLLHALLPEQAARDATLRRLSASIALAESLRQGTWSITAQQGRISLNVGRVYVMVIRQDRLNLSCDATAVDVRAKQAIEGLKVTPWPGGVLPESETVEIPYDRIEDLLSILAPAHEAVVARAAGTSQTAPHANAHSPALTQILREDYGLVVDDPPAHARPLPRPGAPGHDTDSSDLSTALQDILDAYCDARKSAAFSGDHPVFASFQRFTQLLLHTEPVASSPHLRSRFSGGQGNWARVPWVAVMDDRETSTTQRGIYIVYLLREDCSGVYVTLNQGVTEPQNRLGPAAGREWLKARARAVREVLTYSPSSGFQIDDGIDLRSHGLGSSYEASTIAYKFYESGSLPSTEAMIEDLALLVDDYRDVLQKDTEVPAVDIPALLDEFSDALTASNVDFGASHSETVRNFLASTLTRPFVILTGLSGSGKTQIAIKFGEWLGQDRFTLIPVRPDWTGPESLFGFPDILQPLKDGRRAWNVPSALAFMLKASFDPEHPYLLVLDEMNLAHVERYFSDFLSGLESSEPVLPNLAQEGSEWRDSAVDPQPLPIPRNLIVIGTVNVDETTYMFSPKVLDRANTLEFRVATADLGRVIKPIPAQPTGSSSLAHLMAVISDDQWQYQNVPSGSGDFQDNLRNLHLILSRHGAEFGYRTYYDAIRFNAIYCALGGEWHDALDVQVKQKVLPRFHGSRRKLEPILSSLGRFCLDLTTDPTGPGGQEFDPAVPPSVPAKLPRSLEKIRRMTVNLRANQFTSFTE